MSRRAKKIEKRVVLDPKYNSELVAHMIRVIMKDGKKTVAEKIVYGAIDKIAEKMKEDPSKFVKDGRRIPPSSSRTRRLSRIRSRSSPPRSRT